MAFSDEGIKRSIRCSGPRQTHSAGTLTLIHAPADARAQSVTKTTQPSGFTGRLGSPTGPGNALEGFCR
jgi:hypothetical protein